MAGKSVAAVKFYVFYCFLLCLSTRGLVRVTAQEGPGIVIAHPGQDVELLCTVTVTSRSQTTGWLVNNVGPYGINALRSGILTGYTATLGSSNLIVENIMMNDVRNGSEYRCVIIPAQGMITVSDIIEESDPTILYVAATGVPVIVPNVTVDSNTNGNNVTLILSWGEPFNNLDPILNYTVRVSCSGNVTCPPNFTTTDNTTRSYTITNLTPMTNYTFSVVATNSIGSGKAGVVMITTTPGDIITTTSNVGMTTTTTSSVGMTTTTSSVSMTTTTSSVGMTTTTTTTSTTTSSVGMNTTTTTISVGMTTTTAIPSVGMTTTTATSSVGMTTTTAIPSVGMTTTTTATPSVGMTTTTATSSVGMNTTTTSSVGMPTTTSSVGMTTTTSSVDMTTTSVGTVSSPTTIPSNTTASTTIAATTSDSADPTAVPVSNDGTDNNGAVIIAIVVVVILLILCCCVIMDILFCYCYRRKEQYDQNNEEDKTAHYSIIVLGILTFGTSVLLWWMYKECCGSKEKYDVEDRSAVPLSSTKAKKNSRKNKKISNKSADVEMTEAASIQGSPTEITYAATTKPFNGDTHTGPTLQYDYARTGPVKIVDISDAADSTQQPAPTQPILEGYAVTEIISAKDKKKDKKAKVDTKNQQPLEYAIADKKKKGKKDSKQQKPEVSYMDPTNLEFAEEPRNRTLSFGADHTVQYADLAESPKYTNI